MTSKPPIAAGFEIEPYRPGEQKMPVVLLSVMFFGGWFAIHQFTEHIKHHSINKTYPFHSPILDEHFFFNDKLLHKVMNQYHPLLLKEYIWLLVARSVWMFAASFWGVEMLARGYGNFLPPEHARWRIVELVPLLIAFMEIVINAGVVWILYWHPFHAHWLVDVCGYSTLVKHTLTYLCIGVFVYGVARQLYEYTLGPRKLD